MIVIKLESGRFRIGEKVVVSIHGKKYSRKVFDDHGKPYITIDGERAYENDISNNKKFNAIDYRNDFVKKHRDRILVVTEKGNKEIWKSYATDLGMSLNAFIIYCVEAQMHG